jgi:CRISPR/Cas system CSM-associated protein Csm2 small subunit|tara:strand:- start:1300 stop:1530 length:231 start_codon:yes stop_codon:yes gene_type:complete
MDYNVEDIDKILNFKTWSDNKKIDTLLFIDCTLYTNLGKESTQTERQITKSKSKKLYKAIGKIDAAIGKQILNSLD